MWTRCLVVELPPPWHPKVELSRGFPTLLRAAINRAQSGGERLRLQCVLPDPAYSQPGMRRLMLFSRPAGRFVTNRRAEYVVPSEMVAEVSVALIDASTEVERFAGFREPDCRTRDLMVCTHGNRDACCGSFGVPLYETLRRMADEVPVGDGTPIGGAPIGGTGVRVWRVSHTGGHRFAPTLIDMPDGRYWAHLDDELARDVLNRSGDVRALADRYRGWAALDSCAEQAAEKAAFARVGWGWVDAEKEIKTVTQDPEKDSHRVRIEYTESSGGRAGVFEASVEYAGSVPTMNCMKDGTKGDNPQYRVGQITAGP